MCPAETLIGSYFTTSYGKSRQSPVRNMQNWILCSLKYVFFSNSNCPNDRSYQNYPHKPVHTHKHTHTDTHNDLASSLMQFCGVI